MTLLFPTLLYVAGLVAWVTDRRWPWSHRPSAITGAIVAGLGAGAFLSAWGA